MNDQSRAPRAWRWQPGSACPSASIRPNRHCSGRSRNGAGSPRREWSGRNCQYREKERCEVLSSGTPVGISGHRWISSDHDKKVTEARSAQQDLRDLRPPVYLAEEVGTRLGTGQILLEEMRRAARQAVILTWRRRPPVRSAPARSPLRPCRSAASLRRRYHRYRYRTHPSRPGRRAPMRTGIDVPSGNPL